MVLQNKKVNSVEWAVLVLAQKTLYVPCELLPVRHLDDLLSSVKDGIVSGIKRVTA